MSIKMKFEKNRWFLLVTLAFFSLFSVGCEKGSLGAKSSAIKGYVLDAGTNFIGKPFSAADLTRKIREVLDS